VPKTPTVSLVHLSEFKGCGVELAEQRDRETAEKLQPIRSGCGGGGPGRSAQAGSEVSTGSGGKGTKKRKQVVKGKLSFTEEGGGDAGTDDGGCSPSVGSAGSIIEDNNKSGEVQVKKRNVNPQLELPAPTVLTKNTLLREVRERETLRRGFLALQKKIKNEGISILGECLDAWSGSGFPSMCYCLFAVSDNTSRISSTSSFHFRDH